MKVTADLSVIPLGVGLSLSEYIAACQDVLEEAGLEHRMHAFGTNIEGDWDEVMAAVKKCHQAVEAMGAPRVHTTLKLSTRRDRGQGIQDKIDSVREKRR